MARLIHQGINPESGKYKAQITSRLSVRHIMSVIILRISKKNHVYDTLNKMTEYAEYFIHIREKLTADKVPSLSVSTGVLEIKCMCLGGLILFGLLLLPKSSSPFLTKGLMYTFLKEDFRTFKVLKLVNGMTLNLLHDTI